MAGEKGSIKIIKVYVLSKLAAEGFNMKKIYPNQY
jgi:hypothetical protein